MPIKILIPQNTVQKTAANLPQPQVSVSTTIQQTQTSSFISIPTVPKQTATINDVNTKFSVRLPPEEALFVRQNFEQYNLLFRALVQSFMDNRIDRTQVLYKER